MFDINQLAEKIDFANEIIRLKKEKNAVLLAHYYQTPEIQDIADFIGDSLELARKAKSTDADIIVFAGVHFMAETAKILNPQKTVLIPDLEAGCSLADSCPPILFKRFREENPNHIAITYINCSASIKALSDIICTSSNAEKIIRQIPVEQPIIFAPDRNLGAYLSKQTQREMLLWDGTCIVHEAFSEEKIISLKLEYPEAKVIAHPECEEIILRHSDFIGSTSKLLQFVQSDSATQFIVATESGIIHQMEKAEPDKIFIPAPPQENCSCNDCPYMKLNTLEKIYNSLINNSPQIIMEEDLRLKALKPIEKMLEMS
ncbi:MAG TPA: quinolinate synthase NadA [Ignavibacteriaceae bacterium]|nr:quinolinate synthase NadA [Ignavibacteriaceae bacterium]